MRKIMGILVAAVAVVSISSSLAMARSGYLCDLNNTCGTAYDCNFCHDNSNTQAYSNSGACFFCPTAEGCTTPTPDPTCTDGDKDGFFAQRGCAQLCDCNDANVNIYPGAREIPCDGVDQDCSGADKRKGTGCRNQHGLPAVARETGRRARPSSFLVRCLLLPAVLDFGRRSANNPGA